MLKMYEQCFRCGKLSNSARKGLIALIPKKDKDILQLKAWRPLTLLNMDYKILSKTIAESIKTILPSIICEEQTGFLKGHNIQENLRRTFEVVHYTREKNIPSLIVMIDFEKCFDKIEHNSIFAVLRYFNFGETFIQWSKLFFTELECYTQNFGFLSPALKKERGCNQGCNYSPFCYLLCGEIMARKLKTNPKIRGIDIDGVKCLISKFADDTTLFLSFDRLTLEGVIETLDLIAQNIGLTINYDKTCIYHIGSLGKIPSKTLH